MCTAVPPCSRQEHITAHFVNIERLAMRMQLLMGLQVSVHE